MQQRHALVSFPPLSIPHLSPISVSPAISGIPYPSRLSAVCQRDQSTKRPAAGGGRTQLQQSLRVLGRTALQIHPQQQTARLAREPAHSRHAVTHALHNNSWRAHTIALETGTN